MGANIVISTGDLSSAGSGSGSAFFCAFRLFMASFDCLGSAEPGVAFREAVGTLWRGWREVDGRPDLEMGSRPPRDWYVVVMAVVAVEPFAIGVTYSV